MRFTPSMRGFADSGYAGRDFHHTSLTCPQIKRRTTSRGIPPPAQGTEASRPKTAGCGANRSAACVKGMARQHLIASNAAHTIPRACTRGRRVPFALNNSTMRGGAATRSCALRRQGARRKRKTGFHCRGSRAEARDPSRQALKVQAISVRRACGRRSSCRGPAGNARSGHRRWWPDSAPAATAVPRRSTRHRTRRRDRAAR